MTYDPFYDDGPDPRRGCLGLLVFGPGAFVVALALAGARKPATTVAVLWMVVTAAWLIGTWAARVLDPIDDGDDDELVEVDGL